MTYNSPKTSSVDGARSWKPRVYFSGEYSINDWRFEVFPELRTHLNGYGDLLCDGFIYAGPYPEPCGDFSYCRPWISNPASGIANIQRDYELEEQFQKSSVRRMKAIESADLVVCYIESEYSHQTIFEIASAIALRKEVCLCYAPGVDINKFQIAAGFANFAVCDCKNVADLLFNVHDILEGRSDRTTFVNSGAWSHECTCS